MSKDERKWSWTAEADAVGQGGAASRTASIETATFERSEAHAKTTGSRRFRPACSLSE